MTRGIAVLLFTALCISFGAARAADDSGFATETTKKPAEMEWSTSARAEEEEDVERVGEDYRLELGMRVNRDVVVIMGDAEILGDVRRDVVVVMGGLMVSGQIEGDVVVVMGDVELASGSEVLGDVSVLMGRLDRAPGAVVKGEVVSVGSGDWGHLFSPLKRLGKHHKACAVSGVVREIVLGVVILIVFLIAPLATGRIADCLRAQPVESLVIGVGAMFSTIPLTVLLVVTVVGILLVPFVPLVFGVLAVLGTAGAALALGRMVFRTAKPGAGTLAAGMLGFAALEAVRILLPDGFFSGAFVFLVLIFALGAAALTKFGTGESWWASAHTQPAAMGMPPPTEERKIVPPRDSRDGGHQDGAGI